MYSRHWSSRTFQWGDWVLRPCPCAFLQTSAQPSRVLPSSSLIDRHQRYYEPLGLPPSTIPFHHRLIGTAFARRGLPGRVSPVPYQAVWTCPPPYPVGVLHPFRFQDAVCCLRRGMSDSAYPSPFGFLCHEAARFIFRLGPTRSRARSEIFLVQAGCRKPSICLLTCLGCVGSNHLGVKLARS